MTLRPDWDSYFLEFTKAIGKRATCDRGKSGALIVDQDRQIVSSGYVGSPTGMPHCDDIGHVFSSDSKHCIATVHAEQNAIAQAAKRGVSTNKCTIYCTMTPCFECAKLIIQSGITRVYCEYDYHASELSKDLFKTTDVELVIKNKGYNYDV